ncbi:M1 family metallopeptidase [Paenibacillus beijingensis]|uniref:EnpEP protein n=1 Tax=Paenibacillus beijingensis TaxID=1126833 RepID=A0A0D5NJ77_9BACL|nr:M1 family metallopeptidase [Paenibacillus beijingensis]AJY74988.1 EnpEP protein [Paenibacillus beijingensis]
MTPRRAASLLLALFVAILIGLSVRQGYGDAWLSQYTYAAASSRSDIAPNTTSMTVPSPDAAAAGSAPAISGPAAVVETVRPDAAETALSLRPAIAGKASGPAGDAGRSASGPEGQVRSADSGRTTEPAADDAPKAVALSKRVTDYQIDVKLDASGKILTGTETVTWKNPGKKPVSELYFHLYPNAFLSENTTFMKESGGKLRKDKATENSRGYMKLESFKTMDGDSLLPRLHYVQPDDGNKDDFTLAKLRLPEPVYPGAEVALKIGFKVKLPEVFARMGYAGNFVMAGQWFPKLAAYETADSGGHKEGWNAHQYHGNSEFYSDFGLYTVNIQVPASYKVAATGIQTKVPKMAGENKIYQFYAEDVHDFGWAASPDFVYEEEAYSTSGVPGVRIKLYLDPLHADLKDRYMHAAKSALAKYAKWYGEYPYSTLSIVVPPAGGNGAGGMEYPTLITAFAAESKTPGYGLERTVVHEIGHQYWYGMVATNEFEEAWLDEGFTSYSEDKVMQSEYGIEPNSPLEASYMTDPAPLKLLSWSYGSNDRYADNVYTRAKLVLEGIENRVGANTMRAILRTYFQTYKFKHPTTADFQNVVERVTKQNWTDYFSQFVYGSAMADYSVASVRVLPPGPGDSGKYGAEVLIRRSGGANGPVTVEFRFADGSSAEKEWDGAASEMQYKLSSSSPLVWAAVDPVNRNVLDNKHINNFMRSEADGKTRTRFNLGIVKLLESIMGAFAW